MSQTQQPNMIGLELPPVDRWSARVVVALGMNPSMFTGPGTNTYLVGTGRERILVDTGQGLPEYLPVLDRAIDEAGCEAIQEIVLTHGHVDHISGVADIAKRYGVTKVSKFPWPDFDEVCPLAIEPLADGDHVHCEGATLRAVHTPGHAPDHLCFVFEEEGALFSGDNVLGVGTTVIPSGTGDLLDYMNSLKRLRDENPGTIYPAHGPAIPDGVAKIDEYTAHRNAREVQILGALEQGAADIPTIVKRVYTDVPEVLHKAAEQSVASHLKKLARETRAREDGAIWSIV